MSSAADESVWLCSLLLECGFGIPSISSFYEMPSSKETPAAFRSYAVLIPPSPLYGASLESIFTSNNPHTPGKDKHMQVRFFKHRDNIKNGQLRIKFTGTKDNVSDYFTKALLRDEFYKFRALCMNEAEMAEVYI